MRLSIKSMLVVLLILWLFLMIEWIRLIFYQDPFIPFL